MTKDVAVIAVDSGKFLTKAVRVENGEVVDRFEIQSLMSETTETRSQTASTKVVTMNRVSTLLGDISAEYDAETSKEKELHRRATYLSISQLVENGGKVILGIGAPLQVYKNREHRTRYRRFMACADVNKEVEFPVKVKFKVDGESFTFEIMDLIVFPETGGYIVRNEAEYEGQEVAIVDIGGLNVNGAIYRPSGPNGDGEMTMDFDSTFTLNDGGNIFSTKLLDTLNEEFGLNIAPSQIRQIIRAGHVKRIEKESAAIIEKTKEEFFNKIKTRMRQRRWSPETLDFVFVGGGSLLFESSIRQDEDFKYAKISENAQWDNVEGFGLIMESVLAAHV